MSDNQKPFMKPRSLEYPEHFRPGMGTENIAPFLRAMVQMLRPNRILEIGAGYTTPFLLEGLVNNEWVFDDGNLNQKFLEKSAYDPKFVIIDNMPLQELKLLPGFNDLVQCKYTYFIEGFFQGKAAELSREFGAFDFVWFDCGSTSEYESFFSEYWNLCLDYIFFHYTYSNGKPNEKLKTILRNISNTPFKIDIIEPHKTRQGSITIIKK